MATETQDLCTNMYTHKYTNVYTCMCIPTHIHMQIYTYMHVHTHTYIYLCTHTHTTCTYARTQARQERQRLREELMQTPEGPLRSCRKIGGKSVVQQSPNRRARRMPSPKMTKVNVHENQKVNKEQPIRADANHTIMTTRRPDNTRSSVLVRSRSTHFMARPSC